MFCEYINLIWCLGYLVFSLTSHPKVVFLPMWLISERVLEVAQVSVCPFITLSIPPSVCVHFSTYSLSVCSSPHPSIQVCLFLHLSICSFLHLFHCQYVHSSVYLCFPLSVSLFSLLSLQSLYTASIRNTRVLSLYICYFYNSIQIHSAHIGSLLKGFFSISNYFLFSWLKWIGLEYTDWVV